MMLLVLNGSFWNSSMRIRTTTVIVVYNYHFELFTVRQARPVSRKHPSKLSVVVCCLFVIVYRVVVIIAVRLPFSYIELMSVWSLSDNDCSTWYGAERHSCAITFWNRSIGDKQILVIKSGPSHAYQCRDAVEATGPTSVTLRVASMRSAF
jgi:hypothetical protein